MSTWNPIFATRRLLGVAAILCLALTLAGTAGAAAVAGRDYVSISPPLPTDSGGKVEVLEFFWYGCPHCFDLEPALTKWVKNLPKDVEFKRVPAIFRESWVPGAKLYYALEAMGELDRLHKDVFDAIHADRTNLFDEKILTEWLSKKGVDRKKFGETYSSFSVQSKVQRAMQITQASKIQGVPAVAVQGKYVTSNSIAGGMDGIFPILDDLIAKVRAERGGAAKK